MRPSHILQPVRSGGRGHKMGADLRQHMSRHLSAVHGCEGGSLLPAGNTANPGRIGHDEIGRPAVDSHLHCLRSVKVLSDLQWGSQRPDQSAIALPVVLADRLLYPRAPLAIELPSPIQVRKSVVSGKSASDSYIHGSRWIIKKTK